MLMHKRAKAAPVIRQSIWEDYCGGIKSKQILADKYRLSRPTIYKVLKKMRVKYLYPKLSANHRFRELGCGLRRLAKIEASVIKKKNAEARRYNKEYPRELWHMDTKKLPAILGDADKSKEYIFVQAFTRIKRPQTNGKVERFIRTLMEMWYQKEQFSSREQKK